MAFSSTIDTRPNILGNLHMLTGTFTNTGGSSGGDIALAERLSIVLAAGANGGAAGLTDTEIDATVQTTLTLVTAADLDGTWWVLGRRG
jgi:hypothetical protein